jgi:hypothetical protein
MPDNGDTARYSQMKNIQYMYIIFAVYCLRKTFVFDAPFSTVYIMIE